MKIKKVEIEAFRAYKHKPDGVFDFTVDGDTPSDFVSIYAPNGFGKSSLYDAVEWALTNNIHRYITDTHRRSNEVAAKGTKQDGVSQYILRNKDVEVNVETSVLVSTTIKDFSRKLNNVRSDSRDFRFTDRDTDEGTHGFRNIILSQDAIDRFVREVKPEERYELFMEHFGGNAEQVRKTVHTFAHENGAALTLLRANRDKVMLAIDNDVDESVFVSYNQTVKSLADLGEDINPISSNFTATHEHEILSSILTKRHQLGLEIKHANTLVDGLNQQLGNLDNIERLLTRKSEIEPSIVRLKKGLEDNQRYQSSLEYLQKKLAERDGIRLVVHAVKELRADFPSFQTLVDVIQGCNVRRQGLVTVKAEFEARVEGAFFKIRDLDDVLGANQEALQRLADLESSASNIYVEIASARKLQSSLEKQLEAARANAKVDAAALEQLHLEMEKIYSINVSLDGLLTSDISPLEIDDSIIPELVDLRQKLASHDKEIADLRNVQKALADQSNVIERLVALGLEYVSIHPNTKCPLCQADHPDESALRQAIASNRYASEVSETNSDMIKLSLILKAEIERRIDEILSLASVLKAQAVENIQSLVQQLSEKINAAKEDYLLLETQLSNVSERITLRTSKVLGLDSKGLELHIAIEKQRLNSIISAALEDRGAQKLSLDELVRTVNELSGEMAAVDAQVASTKLSDIYVKFKSYIRGTDPNAPDVAGLIDKELANNLNSIEGVDLEINDLEGKLKSLKASMEAENTWLGVDLLKSRMSDVVSEIDRIEVQVTSYHRAISELIKDFDTFKGLPLRQVIEKFLASNRDKSERLQRKISDFELLEIQLQGLLPFVQNIKRREELAAIEIEIEKHVSLAAALDAEMVEINSFLREQIKSYFYTDLINTIYRKIDPHPSFKKVEFVPRFVIGDRPQLAVVISDEEGNTVSPNLYFSAAQLNILSLSVFLARAIHAKHDGMPLDVIMIDDPIHSMDSINILSMIDMLRNISVQFKKQIVISTHDENFFELLQKKIPSNIFKSKFITLQSYGVVSQPQAGLPMAAA